jgi:putative peptide zinc metalloprotease protein
MALLESPTGSAEPPDHPHAPAHPAARPAPPVLAAGVELLGPMAGSGYREAPALARRADGQVLQLTPTIYALAEVIDGARTEPELAAALGERIGMAVDPEQITFLLEEKLRPLGLLRGADGSEPTAAKANPLLALRCRYVVTDTARTERLTAPFAALFRPWVLWPVLVAFFATSAWLLADHGLAQGARHVLYEPQLLLLVLALTLVSAGFHELGHAAACRYGGATPGAMGVGLYLVFPAFYTDVSDSYRLSRRGRLRTDLGGLYFNAVFAVGAFVAWWLTGSEALLVIIPLQQLQMLKQLAPFVRLDGYHVLADLTGVPDLFSRVRPVLLGLLPWHWGRSDAKALKPWVRAVVTLWVLFVVPILLFTMVTMIVTFPRLVATVWDSAGLQWQDLTGRWRDGDVVRLVLSAVSMLTLLLPLCSVSYFISRLVRRTGLRVWRGTEGNPPLRAAPCRAAPSTRRRRGRRRRRPTAVGRRRRRPPRPTRRSWSWRSTRRRSRGRCRRCRTTSSASPTRPARATTRPSP